MYWRQLILPLAFICEYIDSTLGMGYGTTLVPILLLMGFEPSQCVPAVLFSELITGILAGVFHQRQGNADFGWHSRSLRVTWVLVACGLVGTQLAVYISLSIPPILVKGYIGLLALSMGTIILLTLDKVYPFCWNRIIGIGFLAAFNKGISGGGYGPLVTSGQILSGEDCKEAVSITSLSEGLVCLVGVMAYTFVGDKSIDWSLAIPLTIGAVVSVPLAVVTVQKLPTDKMRRLIGIATVALGAFILAKVIN